MSRILKNFDAEAAGATPFQFEDVRKMAKRILESATQQAKRKIMVAEAHAKEIEQVGYDDGFQKGEKEGYEKGEKDGHAAGDKAARDAFNQRAAPVAPAIESLLTDLESRKVALRSEAEADLLRLSLELARRVVRRELLIDERSIVPVVQDAVALAADRSDLVAHLNPADLAAMEEELPALRAKFTDIGRVQLAADESISRGGVRLVSKTSEIDMRLEEQFAALERALLGEAVDEVQPETLTPPATEETLSEETTPDVPAGDDSTGEESGEINNPDSQDGVEPDEDAL